METSIKNRDTSLDMIRMFALAMVMSVHSIRTLGFYDLTIKGFDMFVVTFCRQFSLCCVPLFIMLTGYLMNKKTLSKKYYLGIARTIGIYVLASVVIGVVRIFCGDEFTVKTFLLGILDFTLAPYSWYVEMYIGLFLLIPFLNLIYWGLNSKKEKLWLIITMILLVSIPKILNVYNITDDNFMCELFSKIGTQKLFPDFWKSIYPILYYFLGAFIYEYKPKIKKVLNIVLMFTSTVVFTLFIFFKNKGEKFIWTEASDYGSLFNVIIACLVFIFLKNIDTSRFNKTIVKILKYMAGLCFGAYLVSCIFDTEVVNYLFLDLIDTVERVQKFPIAALLVYVCSFYVSAGINLIYDLLKKIGGKIKKLHL